MLKENYLDTANENELYFLYDWFEIRICGKSSAVISITSEWEIQQKQNHWTPN